MTDRTANDMERGAMGARICLVGPGWRFTSGISYYTCRLAHAIAAHNELSVVQLRQLLPSRLYPGRRRVGRGGTRMTYPAGSPVFEGIDWWWVPSIARALAFIRSRRPQVIVLEWWTCATLHTYVAIAMVSRLLGGRLVIEIHELQDPGEARFRLARRYGEAGLGVLLRLCHGCVVHSQADLAALRASYIPGDKPAAVAPHGPYDQYLSLDPGSGLASPSAVAVQRAPRPAAINILFFGLIRPYKGLDDLLRVFNGLPENEARHLWLTVVGETWDGCTEPARLIEESPYRDRITFVNEYVADDVVAAAFAHADMVVLPYRRSASSGTLHLAMSFGLPVVLTSVGGLPEAARGYQGAIFVPPGDLTALAAAILRATRMRGQRFPDPRNWAETVRAILAAAEIAPRPPREAGGEMPVLSGTPGPGAGNRL